MERNFSLYTSLEGELLGERSRSRDQGDVVLETELDTETSTEIEKIRPTTVPLSGIYVTIRDPEPRERLLTEPFKARQVGRVPAAKVNISSSRSSPTFRGNRHLTH